MSERTLLLLLLLLLLLKMTLALVGQSSDCKVLLG
jgi:hypothetical protein